MIACLQACINVCVDIVCYVNCFVLQISNDSRLRECRSQDGEKVPWAFTHQIVGHPFTDGIGHSLVTFMRQLYIAIMYGCRSTLPTRQVLDESWKKQFVKLVRGCTDSMNLL